MPIRMFYKKDERKESLKKQKARENKKKKSAFIGEDQFKSHA